MGYSSGTSICGTGGKDGLRPQGFDETAKSRAEFEMLTELGVKMINSHLAGVDESRAFTDYAILGHSKVMGFPSGHSDAFLDVQKRAWRPSRVCLG